MEQEEGKTRLAALEIARATHRDKSQDVIIKAAEAYRKFLMGESE